METQRNLINPGGKNDHALVACDMWNYRILPLFPRLSQRFIKSFRELILNQHRQRIYLEFLAYLWAIYPLEYLRWLLQRKALLVGSTEVAPKQGGSCGFFFRTAGVPSHFQRLTWTLTETPVDKVQDAALTHDIGVGV